MLLLRLSVVEIVEIVCLCVVVFVDFGSQKNYIFKKNYFFFIFSLLTLSYVSWLLFVCSFPIKRQLPWQ